MPRILKACAGAIVGGLLGALVTPMIVWLWPLGPGVSDWTITGYFAISGACVGMFGWERTIILMNDATDLVDQPECGAPQDQGHSQQESLDKRNQPMGERRGDSNRR